MSRGRIGSLGAMKTLRAKLTLLMVGAVLLVVALATWLSFLFLAPPRFQLAEDATAIQLALLADLAAHIPDNGEATELRLGQFGLRTKPPAAAPDEPSGPPGPPPPDERPGMGPGPLRRALDAIFGPPPPPPHFGNESPPARGVNAALQRLGRSERVEVHDRPSYPTPVISMRIADGRWLTVPLPIVPPQEDRGMALIAWAMLIALGATAVAVVMVRRLTEPLALIERSVAAVGPDGEFAPLPEDGPAEVRAAASAVNRLSARLRGAMESRMRLVAAAGHDLRTPMTRMRLRAEFLDSEDKDSWISDLDELDRIADSAIRLVREEVEPSSRTAIALDVLVRDVASDLAHQGLAVELEGTVPTLVFGRPLSLKRAVRNLVINAATHGRGAQVRVTRERRQAVIIIMDRGPGIPEELMARAFEPFFRIDPARTQAVPGAGLGLAIAHEIVGRNGGRLTLRNRSGGGLEQCVTLPLAPGAEEPGASG
ncbi:ATP-binding protein [Ancylobacter sp. 6x-1]|uniref:histidine kinase n=1 Tax=Ancylobacter crimeensis TaxID=2579147 RepID=A0ABT0D7D7_9HYPH|nr:ATP-binding protein [Ancylobacter crimeensis]MCK0195865.1 ATP-binding protein [Ancylobacter crimeensis]